MSISVKEILAQNAALIEKALIERSQSTPTLAGLHDDAALETLVKAQDYSLLAGGKRIRPSLVIEGCRALGGDVSCAVAPACAVEMIHTYSLIHDDLPSMDNDDLRRGKPTCHRVFGEASAILAGDGLLSDAFGVLACAPFLSDGVRVLAVRILAEAAGSIGMVGGQVTDMEGASRTLSMEQLIALHARKTGALIRASAKLGAVCAGLTPKDAGFIALDEYAKRIGLAFQIVDDVLDVTADEALLGKTKGKDSAEHKTTFLTYYSVEQAREYARRLTDEACEAIAPFDGQGTLGALADYLAERMY